MVRSSKRPKMVVCVTALAILFLGFCQKSWGLRRIVGRRLWRRARKRAMSWFPFLLVLI